MLYLVELIASIDDSNQFLGIDSLRNMVFNSHCSIYIYIYYVIWPCPSPGSQQVSLIFQGYWFWSDSSCWWPLPPCQSLDVFATIFLWIVFLAICHHFLFFHQISNCSCCQSLYKDSYLRAFLSIPVLFYYVMGGLDSASKHALLLLEIIAHLFISLLFVSSIFLLFVYSSSLSLSTSSWLVFSFLFSKSLWFLSLMLHQGYYCVKGEPLSLILVKKVLIKNNLISSPSWSTVLVYFLAGDQSTSSYMFNLISMVFFNAHNFVFK